MLCCAVLCVLCCAVLCCAVLLRSFVLVCALLRFGAIAGLTLKMGIESDTQASAVVDTVPLVEGFVVVRHGVKVSACGSPTARCTEVKPFRTGLGAPLKRKCASVH